MIIIKLTHAVYDHHNFFIRQNIIKFKLIMKNKKGSSFPVKLQEDISINRPYYKRLMTYQGLVNQGATCYLNSLLQTLFMTHQFRQNIYSYVHDPKKIAQKDSIPFQLQKLFVNLQTKGQCCLTKDLLRSFQWTQADAFQQHDVQQFCRKLFDAIEASHKNTFWIKQLFGFLISSYIDCGTHRSTRPQQYLDLSLPVRNQYTKQLYNSLEECLKSYLMPQQLEGVQCSGCQSKVTVKKGMCFQSMPAIFTIQLNRFQLNYDTMQREKINSFLYYPEMLELHRLMKPYQQIELKGIPKDIKIGAVTLQKEKSKRTQQLDFGAVDAAKKKRKNSDDKLAAKQHVTYLDEQNKDKRTAQTKQLSKQEQKNKHLEILADLKQNKFKDIKEIKKQTNKPPPPKLENDFEDDMLFSTLAFGYKFDSPIISDPFEKKPTFETTQTRYQHQQESFDITKQYPDGTYALYAVLIHSGGSYGGHYYAYIFDGKDWFKFNDSTVSKVNKYEIRQYGSNSEASNGTNAYLLFYRNVKTFKPLEEIQIPTELIEKVKIQNQKSEKREEYQKLAVKDRQKRLQEINSAVIIKVFKADTAQPLTIKVQDRKLESILTLREKIKVGSNINEKDENWRLRRYNKTDDSMHEVYDLSLGAASLQSIGFRQNIYLIVQLKSDEQVFQEYDPRRIIVKVNVWRPNIIMVAQKKLKPIKISISQLAKYEQLYSQIQQQTGIQKVLVIRRNYTSSQPITSILVEENRDKKLIDLRFFNNINLYVEEMSESIEVKWGKEFQKERFRCNIKFNNPKDGDCRDQEIYFDSRRSLGELKKQISQIIGIPQDMFRIKKGKQLPQLTVFKKKLSDLRFINNQILYIQQGKSSQGSILVKRGTVELVDNQIQYSLHQQLQFDITNDLVLASDLCRKISESTGIPAQNIRLREYTASQFKEIYSKNELIMRLKNKTVVWELCNQEHRGYQIYYRVFDIINMEVGPLKEINVDNTASYEQFCLLLEEETGIASDRILISKPISTFCDISTLLDCEWSQTRFINDVIKQEPLSIRCDGDFILLKQADEPYKPPKVVRKPQAATTKEKGGEAQLKITVIAQKDPEQEPQSPPSIQSKQTAPQ